VASLHPARRRLIRAAAECQAWEALVCRDAGEFLRAAFKRSVPLIVVDLPAVESRDYWDLREATERAKSVSQALIVISGAGAADGEELWLRRLGAWSYLSEANSQRGFEFLFSEARTALARSEQARSAPMAPKRHDQEAFDEKQ
jgi:hypothetical protein